MAPIKKGVRHGDYCEKNRNAAILTDFIVPNKSTVAMVDNWWPWKLQFQH